MKKPIRWVLSGVFLLAVLLVVGALVVRQRSSQALHTVAASEGSGIQMDSDYRRITVDGRDYTYNNQITLILYAGIDSDAALETYNRYTIAPRADSVELIILDQYHKKISILALSRDTIASIGRYTMNGNFRGYYDAQLGYAYAFGDGGKASCQNLLDAVSRILGGIPIHEYVITNRGSIVRINDMMGGVTVTVPNDELAQKHPELTAGSTVRLTADNVTDFVSWRDTGLPFSNNARMQRQRAFSTAFLSMFRERAAREPDAVWAEIERMGPDMQTSITKGQYLNLLTYLSEDTFSEDDYYFLEGRDAAGPEHDEVYLEAEQCAQTILKLFYLNDEE
ncbi:MAG: LCP family protein [Faecousia sp.]